MKVVQWLSSQNFNRIDMIVMAGVFTNIANGFYLHAGIWFVVGTFVSVIFEMVSRRTV